MVTHNTLLFNLFFMTIRFDNMILQRPFSACVQRSEGVLGSGFYLNQLYDQKKELRFLLRVGDRGTMSGHSLCKTSSSSHSSMPVTSHRCQSVGINNSKHDTPSAKVLPIHGVSEKVVGVLGGGQLGRMLCQAASCLGIKMLILDPSENCPASSICSRHVLGSFDDAESVEKFAKECDVLTVEIEHVDAATLEKLEKEGVDCQPKASTIRIIQNKYQQKVHFSQHGIPLPDFMQIDNVENTMRAGDIFGYPLVIKSKTLAYDGRGNSVAYKKEDLDSAVSALGGYNRGLYAERCVSFVKELAVIVARGRDGSVSCFPVVETIHRENICHIVKAPADVPEKVQKQACAVALRAVGSLEGAGIFAVELFLTSSGEILLNEVAPRPHNSGHHTIESCYTSQFEQHLRAIVGLPLGDSSMKTASAIMYNLLGEEEGDLGFHLAHKSMKRALTIPGSAVHWYDKLDIRKQRKMGHITLLGSSSSLVKAHLEFLLNEEMEANNAVIPSVGIIMGSDSDLPIMKDAASVLESFNVPYEISIVSAHRTPGRMVSYASNARERGVQVIIAGAGGAAHLPGMVASLTSLPVIGVPVKTSSLDGQDSLLSIVQMPKGVPVATVAIQNATNAGLLAVRILGIVDPVLQRRMIDYQDGMREAVLSKAEKLEKEGWKKYLGES